MGDKLKDKVAVITGSGSGIGKAEAIAMAQEGAKVVTNNRKPGSEGGDAEITASQIQDMGGEAVPFFGDVGDFETARKLMQTAVDSFGKIDILINNAGIARRTPIWETTEQEFDETIRIHVKGTFNCIKHACGVMMEQKWGRIINTSSLIWLRNANYGSYAMAKAGMIGFTRTIAMDLKEYGITCNAIAPIARSRMMGDAESIARFTQMYEAGLITRSYYELATNPPAPETVPPLVLYLCTDEAASITGNLFRIIGGHIAHCCLPVDRTCIDKAEGLWTVAELAEKVPGVLFEGYKDPTELLPT